MKLMKARREFFDGTASLPVVHDDGGRAQAGFRGDARDCVCRSIAIATGLPYRTVYDDLNELSKSERLSKRKRRKSSSRTGVHTPTIRKYLASLGWRWAPTMHIGSGCQVHLIESEIPSGRLVVRLSKHVTAVIDGVIHDTHDPQRASVITENEVARIAHRCVYGYWKKD